MNDATRQKLKGIVALFGKNSYLDAKRCEDLLRNLAGPKAPEVPLLVAAVREGIVAALAASRNPEAPRALLNAQAEDLADRASIPMEQALWVIESWAFALGIIKIEDCTLTGSDLEGAPDTPGARRSEESTGTRRNPILYVGGLGYNTFQTLAEALSRVQPDGKIVVRPGLYRESAVIDRSISIIGEGDVQEIVIEGVEAPALSIRAGMATIRGLTLRCNDHYGLEVTGGEPVIEDCDITSAWYACVDIRGETTSPTLRNCRIHHGEQRGVYFHEGARGLLDECDVFSHIHPGITIESDADPVVKGCRIHGGQTNGVLVSSGGRGVIEACDIFENNWSGLEITRGGNPLVLRCQIHDGRRFGVLVQEGGTGRIEQCDLHSNSWAALSIQHRGNPVVLDCKLRDGRESGLLIYNDAEGTVEGCELFGNVMAGAIIARGSHPTIRRCHFHDGLQQGILVRENGKGVIEDCVFTTNTGPGIEVNQGSQPVFQRCEIRDGKDVGIVVSSEGGGAFEHCIVSGNVSGDTRISTDSHPRFIP